MKIKTIKILTIVILVLLVTTSICYAAIPIGPIIDEPAPTCINTPSPFMILVLSVTIIINLCLIWSYKITTKAKSILISIIPIMLGIVSIIMLNHYEYASIKSRNINIGGLILYGIDIFIVLMTIIYTIVKKNEKK